MFRVAVVMLLCFLAQLNGMAQAQNMARKGSAQELPLKTDDVMQPHVAAHRMARKSGILMEAGTPNIHDPIEDGSEPQKKRMTRNVAVEVKADAEMVNVK